MVFFFGFFVSNIDSKFYNQFDVVTMVMMPCLCLDHNDEKSIQHKVVIKFHT